MSDNEVTNKELARLIENLAVSTAEGFSKLERKIDGVELKLQTQINDLSNDLKSFNNDANDRFDILEEKFDDLADTVTNHDQRIEKLEDKVFA
ncbi:MAG: hypothetical protein ACKOW9_05670 [Candidatus Paceibacterota bacterium]